MLLSGLNDQSYLLFGYSHVVLDFREDSRLDEVTFVSHTLATGLQSGALRLTASNKLCDLFELGIIYLDQING